MAFAARFRVVACESDGEGTMATVSRCVERDTGREYAARRIKSTPRNRHLKQVACLGAAAAAMGPSACPHACLPLWTFVDDGAIVQVLPWFAGGDLMDRVIAGPPVTPAEFDRVLRALAAALAACHEAGGAHGDVKPENVVLSDTDLLAADIALVDWDMFTAGELAPYAVGTPYYHGPEWADAKRAPIVPLRRRQQHNMYALGATLYITYERKFPRPNRHKPIWSPRRLVGPARAIVMALLNDNPDRRPTARELLSTSERPTQETHRFSVRSTGRGSRRRHTLT